MFCFKRRPHFVPGVQNEIVRAQAEELSSVVMWGSSSSSSGHEESQQERTSSMFVTDPLWRRLLEEVPLDSVPQELLLNIFENLTVLVHFHAGQVLPLGSAALAALSCPELTPSLYVCYKGVMLTYHGRMQRYLKRLLGTSVLLSLLAATHPDTRDATAAFNTSLRRNLLVCLCCPVKGVRSASEALLLDVYGLQRTKADLEQAVRELARSSPEEATDAMEELLDICNKVSKLILLIKLV